MFLGRRYRKLGILGINSRNVDYIFKYNPRKRYPFADDKLKFKAIALEAGLSVPELYGSISSVGEGRKLYKLLKRHPDCVIKPAHGSGGEGVMVLTDSVTDNQFQRANGEVVSFSDVKHHIAKTLHGMYSLGGQNDKAMIEYRVQIDPVFENVTYRGVPDIRIIVFKGVPVLAMLRLPTRASNGRANLHQGAVAAGVDLGTGITLNGVQGSTPVAKHPDSGYSIEGIKIPQWENLLENASRCYDLTGLGYLGVDLVLDVDKGPMILEINARPGLAVQIANGLGLRALLEHVEQEGRLLSGTDARIAFGQSAVKFCKKLKSYAKTPVVTNETETAS